MDWIVSVFSWPSYFAGIVPVAAVLLLREHRHSHRTVAWALGLSFLADSWTLLTKDVWGVSYVYALPQVCLIVGILVSRSQMTNLLWVMLSWATVLSVIGGRFDQPEVFVTGLGGAAITVLAWNRYELGRLRDALLLVFGVGTLFRILWTPFMGHPAWFFFVFIGYQVCRAYGTALFVISVRHGRREPCLV